MGKHRTAVREDLRRALVQLARDVDEALAPAVDLGYDHISEELFVMSVDVGRLLVALDTGQVHIVASRRLGPL